MMGEHMDDHRRFSRRDLLRILGASGLVTASELTWWTEPFGWPAKAHASTPVRFQFSLPEPIRIALIESLAERFNKSQSDVTVKVDFVPQAQARQKLITAVAAKNPPDCCHMWDAWLGEFAGMGAVEDLTDRVKQWKHYADTMPAAWQMVTVNGRILAFPWSFLNDGIFIRSDRVKEYGLRMPPEDWNWDDFLTLARGLTKPDRNQYGFGMRGQGTWAVLYATEFMYGNGAQVLKDGKVVINSPEAVAALQWYLDLFRRHKVTPPSVPTDGYRQLVEGFGRGVTSTYLHNSGSAEEQKQYVGEKNIASLPLPLGPAGTRTSFYFAEPLVLFRDSRNKEAAWQFMTWLMDDEANQRYCTALGLLSSRPPLTDIPQYRHPAYRGFLHSLPFSIVSPYLAYAGWGGKLDSEGVPLMQHALLGKIGPKECLDRLAEVLTRNMV
jgi:multiple sugar transport system substrate-binding protein